MFVILLPHMACLQTNSPSAAGDNKHTQLQPYFNPTAISESDFTMSEKEQKYGSDHGIHTGGGSKQHSYYKPSNFFFFKCASIWIPLWVLEGDHKEQCCQLLTNDFVNPPNLCLIL